MSSWAQRVGVVEDQHDTFKGRLSKVERRLTVLEGKGHNTPGCKGYIDLTDPDNQILRMCKCLDCQLRRSEDLHEAGYI